MICNRLTCFVILLATAFLSANSICFAASLTPPIPILFDEEINDNYTAIDDGSAIAGWSGDNVQTACLPGGEDPQPAASEEIPPLSDTDDWIALWSAFDLPDKR